VITVRSPTSI